MSFKPLDFLEAFRKMSLPIIVFAFSVLSLALFLPDAFADTISIKTFRDAYRIYLGPAWLLSVGLFGAKITTTFVGIARGRRQAKALREQLHSLTPEEKGYLIPFIIGRVNSIYVGIEDGVAAGLVSKRILYRPSSIGDVLNGFAHNIQPWAREYLEKHQELLEGYFGKPQTPREKLHMGW